MCLFVYYHVYATNSQTVFLEQANLIGFPECQHEGLAPIVLFGSFFYFSMTLEPEFFYNLLLFLF